VQREFAFAPEPEWEIAAAVRMLTDHGARQLRQPDYGLTPGARLVVLDAETTRGGGS
jgi:hypothetical protein